MDRVKQTVLKVYPHNYVNGGTAELKQLLNEGWVISQVILSVEDKTGGKIYDYILQKTLD